MVAELVPTRTSGARPPFEPPPPVGYDPDPGSRDWDMLTYLIDNVQRLLRRMSEELSPDNMHLYVDLLEKRRAWIKGEMETERMLGAPPAAPLGLDEDPYSLASLFQEFTNPRFRQYRQLLELVDDVYQRLQRQILDQKREPWAS